MSVLNRLSREHLDCRSMGHAWEHLDDYEWQTDGPGQLVSFARHERCVRCRAIRSRTVDLDRGEITRRSISYPDGYLLPTGGRRIRRAQVLAHDYERSQK